MSEKNINSNKFITERDPGIGIDQSPIPNPRNSSSERRSTINFPTGDFAQYNWLWNNFKKKKVNFFAWYLIVEFFHKQKKLIFNLIFNYSRTYFLVHFWQFALVFFFHRNDLVRFLWFLLWIWESKNAKYFFRKKKSNTPPPPLICGAGTFSKAKFWGGHFLFLTTRFIAENFQQ